MPICWCNVCFLMFGLLRIEKTSLLCTDTKISNPKLHGMRFSYKRYKLADPKDGSLKVQ